MTLKRLTKISMLTAFLSVSVFLIPSFKLPIIGIDFTLQTAVIVLIGYLLKPTDAFIAVFTYLILGLIGLPIFSNKTGGISPFLGPTAGFLYLFPIMAFFISLTKSKSKKTIYDIPMAVLVSVVFVYPIAVIFFSNYTKMPYIDAIIYFLPYMLGDFLKIILAYLVYKKLPIDETYL